MKYLIYFLTASLVGTTAFAGQDPVNERIEAVLDKFDKNGDGEITQEEAGKFWKRLGRADLNSDGKVTREEMEKAWGERPPRPEPGPGPKPKN